ncbi:MAG: hypothetical protein JWR80_9666 [Bradyrhizobium sp.]|nr:hypothetical protein [Bradyrhizobium sp.]
MRPDDNSLNQQQLKQVENVATGLLHRADAWGKIPIPLDDLLNAAKLKVAPYSIFDPRSIAAYAAAKGAKAASIVKQALGKIFGVLDAYEEVIHIDDTVHESRQLFLKLHEAGHFELPHQRKIFRFFEDSESELDPMIADLFEREANNFARFVMFNGGEFARRASDLPLAFGTAKKMQRDFKVSLYAGLREYTRTHQHPCFALALENAKFCPQDGFRAEVRRIEVSPAYELQFGRPQSVVITAKHSLGRLVPFGRKATKPTTFQLTDLAGNAHEFVGEALDTTFNILVFAAPTALYKR